MGYPHHRELMNDTYVYLNFWVSRHFFFFFQRESLGSGLPNIRGATSGPKLGNYPQWQRWRLRTQSYRYASFPQLSAPQTLCSPTEACHAYCREITREERCEHHTNPQPVHLILSPPPFSLKNKLGFVVPVKLSESCPQTRSLFVAHIKWCLLSISSQY